MRTRDTFKENSVRKKALEMIVKEGFDGLSMQRLAKSAGVSPATIYIYFKHREDLIIQLAVEISDRIFKATFLNFDPSMKLREGLKVQWMNRAHHCIKFPLEMKFLEQVRHSPLNSKVIKLTGNRFKEMMGEFVGNAIRRKELAEMPVEILWAIAFAPLYTLVEFHMSKYSFIPGKKFVLDERAMDLALDKVIKALRP
jgi:AcrR family transcriptional regulator